MTIETIFLLSSGLFLGWSLGANDAGNVFGAAVGSRMIRFSTAILVCSIFMVLRAVWSGDGVSIGLVELGSVNVLGGAFMVAHSCARCFSDAPDRHPSLDHTSPDRFVAGLECFCRVSTDPAISRLSGGYLGRCWHGFAMATWFAADPATAGLALCAWMPTHAWPAWLWALGAYSLGANNIANVSASSSITTLPSSQLAGLEFTNPTTAIGRES